MWSATCKTQLHGRPMPAATGCLRGLESDLPIRVSASIPVFNIICIMRNITGVAQGTWNADFCCARGLLRAFRARSLRRISRLFQEVLRALWRPGSTAFILPHRRPLFCGPGASVHRHIVRETDSLCRAYATACTMCWQTTPSSAASSEQPG